MIVKLTAATSYKVEIDGTEIPGAFSDDGKWNGMSCVKGEKGKIVFIDTDPQLFARLFGRDIPTEGQLVSASPEIIALIK